MTEQSNTWTLQGGRAFKPAPFGVMGIVNVTPDSFYDGGKHQSAEAGLAHALQLWREGAHILDLGAESSRPGSEPLSVEEELSRLLPVLEPLLSHCAAAPAHMPTPFISVDTYHSATAKTVLERGAHILNDISACLHEPELMEVVAHFKPGYVLMHAQGKPKTMQVQPHYHHVLDEVLAFFEERMQALTAAGLPESHIVLDPGIGFGKSFTHNMVLLQNMPRLLALGRPVLMALSMKSLFAGMLELPEPGTENLAQRLHATQTATALLAAQGVRLHRVHHVAQTLRTLTVCQAMVPTV